MKFFAGLVTWLCCGIIAAGLLNADLKRQYKKLQQDPLVAKRDLGFSVGMGLIGGPAALTVAFFITGFGASGWTLSASKTPCTDDPKIWCGQ